MLRLRLGAGGVLLSRITAEAARRLTCARDSRSGPW